MTRHLKLSLTWLLLLVVGVTGCHPTQPFYANESGDLSLYLDSATGISEPDVYVPHLAEAEQSLPPLTLWNPHPESEWDLTLEQAINIAMNNSKIIRNLGLVTPVGFADGLIGRTATSASIWDPAIAETDPTSGTEAVLSTFDASFETSVRR